MDKKIQKNLKELLDKVAKEFNIIAFYDDKKLGELGKKIFRQKTVDAWKSLVQRWDPVGTKKNWGRTLRPVAKKFFQNHLRTIRNGPKCNDLKTIPSDPKSGRRRIASSRFVPHVLCWGC